MRQAAVLFAALLCPQGGCAFNVALRRAGVASRAPRLATVAAVADGDEAEKPATTTTAQEKRLAAERLALEAERAALEAERVELELAQLKLERGAKEEEKREPASVTTAAPPAPPPAVTPPAPPAVAPAEPPAATPPTPAEEAKPAFGFFNVNMTELPPPPPLTYGSIARLAEGKEPAALQLSDEQIEAAKARVFNLESFYVMKVEQTFLGTIFRGNLRTNSSIAYERVVAAAAGAPELSGITFVLLDDPISPSLEDLQTGNEQERRPVFLALQADATTLKQDAIDVAAAVGGLLISAVTTLGFALSTYLLADGGRFLDALEKGDTAPLDAASPIAAGIGAVFVAHELAHFGAAAKNGLQTGVPVPLPSLQLGLFGCITRLRGLAPNRQALLEFALAGPAVGGALSLLVFLLGLALSIDLPLPDDVAANLAVIAGAASAGGTAPGAAAAAADAAAAAAKSAAPLSELSPVVPSSLLQTSLLLGSMASIFLPDLATSPAVVVHPLALVGFVGTLVNALQLLPIGRLDGGRVASAVLGQSNAAIVSSASLLLLGLSTLFGGDNPILLFFGLVVIFLQRAQELPCRDDVTGVSTAGKIAAGLGLAFCVLTLLPYPGAPVPMGGTPDVLSTLF